MKLKTEIEEELRAAGADALLQANRTPCFAVPDNYFSQLPGEMIRQVQAEADVLPPVLSTIGNRNPFGVPEHYFDSVSDNILQQVTGHTPAKVIPLHAPRKKRLKNYLVAASVVALLALAGTYFWQSNSYSNITKGMSITGMENIPDESLKNFLLESDYTVDDLAENPEIMFLGQSFAAEESSLERLLNEMPDEDLVYYASEIL